jgi:hypothetical protein
LLANIEARRFLQIKFGALIGNPTSRDYVDVSVTILRKAGALALADADERESAFRHRIARQCHLLGMKNQPALEIDL